MGSGGRHRSGSAEILIGTWRLNASKLWNDSRKVCCLSITFWVSFEGSRKTLLGLQVTDAEDVPGLSHKDAHAAGMASQAPHFFGTLF